MSPMNMREEMPTEGFTKNFTRRGDRLVTVYLCDTPEIKQQVIQAFKDQYLGPPNWYNIDEYQVNNQGKYKVEIITF